MALTTYFAGITQKKDNRDLNYNGIHFFKQCVTAMAEAIRLDMLEKVKTSPLRCLSSDETSRHRKNMLSICYKYFVGSLEDNTLETRTSFAAIRQLPDGTAKSVFSACREQERRDGLPITTLAVYCADGKNVNSGCKQGVAIQYQELQPTCVFTY